MVYLIQQEEPAGDAVGRVLREQTQRVLVLLADWEADPADRIHRARQTCKRLRAVTRLLRTAAPYVAEVENRFVRDIQRRLAYARDAEAMVEALDFLQVGVTEPRLQESVAMLRESLAGRALRSMEDHRPSLKAQVDLACAELRAADARLERLPLPGFRRRDFRRGAERTIERCARGFAGLDSTSSAQAFHAWRRHIKYAFYQTQILALLMPLEAATLGPRLRELAALLGHGQDLVLLDALLRQQPDALSIDTHVQRLRRLIADSLEQLRRRALEVGHELFAVAKAETDAQGHVVPEQQRAGI